MAEFATLTAVEIAKLVDSGAVAAAEITERCLARIDECEARIGAFLAIDAEGARGRAAVLDRRRLAGERLGRLAGVPIAIKDNLSVAGQPLTCGSRILEGYVAPFTATAIERCLSEGAVLVGRTNLDEFAMGSSCENSAFQLTRNPWDHERVPGGSSGGSAASVAVGAVPLALGSDTGGSVRQPAAFCGIVGLKPTYGRVSRSGLVAFASSLDQIGPLARNVEDAALALEVIAGPDPRDATASTRAVPSYLKNLEEGIRGMRVGLVREISDGQLDPASRNVWRRSIRRLESLGAELHEISIPNLEGAIAAYYVVANSEASTNLARFDGIRYGRRERESTLAQTYSRSRSRGFGIEVKRRIMLGTFALSSGYYEAYYRRAQGVVAGLRRQLEAAFEEVDLIATPTTPGGAFRIGERIEDPLAMYLSDIFTTPANLVGLPAIALPAGSDDNGLPLSVQLMARQFDEVRLLRAARGFERDLAWRVVPAFEGVIDAD